MTAILAAIGAGYGVHLLWTSVVLGWQGLRPGPAERREQVGPRVRAWLAQAGLDDVTPAEFAGVTVAVGVLGALTGAVVFGPGPAAIVAGAWAAGAPSAVHRSRRRHRIEVAQEAWPHLIEEIRLLTGAVGQSIPQALFEAGRRGPVELQRAFDAAHREWLLTTDFARTTTVLKDRLADPTADVTCETLLVAHEVGGTDLDHRLAALVEDRVADLQDRRDGRARQAGVRFARRFVLIVPLGMAAVGLSVGSGRAAYQTPQAQLLVLIGLLVLASCWVWSGRIMRLPDQERVFA